MYQLQYEVQRNLRRKSEQSPLECAVFFTEIQKIRLEGLNSSFLALRPTPGTPDTF